MEIAGVSAPAAAQAGQTDGDALSLAVLKKALDAETQAAAALIQTLDQANPSASLPAHLGNNVNTAV